MHGLLPPKLGGQNRILGLNMLTESGRQKCCQFFKVTHYRAFLPLDGQLKGRNNEGQGCGISVHRR